MPGVMNAIDSDRLERAYQTALAALLAERAPEGHWVGELSTSALSTAVALLLCLAFCGLFTLRRLVRFCGPFDHRISNCFRFDGELPITTGNVTFPRFYEFAEPGEAAREGTPCAWRVASVKLDRHNFSRRKPLRSQSQSPPWRRKVAAETASRSVH